MKTEVLSGRASETLDRATEALRRGDLVAVPTETVYGLAADGLREEAVLKIFQAKSRPRFDPLIVHLPGVDWVDRLAKMDDGVVPQFGELHKHFWPGPLTFVFPRKTVVPDVVTAGLETVAVRVSAHPVLTAILRKFGGPVAAPSANRFGRISPTTAAHVVDELAGLIPLVIDGGPTNHGIESTIVALRNGRIEVLRRGPVTEEELAEFGDVVVVAASSHPEAPGQLPTHYAPETPLQLIADGSSFSPPANKRCGLLAWKGSLLQHFSTVRRLSEREDLAEAARNLFRYLRELDGAGLDLIVAERVPEQGLGAAINDRLRRAAARASRPCERAPLR